MNLEQAREIVRRDADLGRRMTSLDAAVALVSECERLAEELSEARLAVLETGHSPPSRSPEPRGRFRRRREQWEPR
jgi:hypothetical protein